MINDGCFFLAKNTRWLPLFCDLCHDGIHAGKVANADKRYKAPHEEDLFNKTISFYHEVKFLFRNIGKACLL